MLSVKHIEKFQLGSSSKFVAYAYRLKLFWFVLSLTTQLKLLTVLVKKLN